MILLLSFIAIFLTTSIGDAATISVVPEQSIQSAIDEADEGDVVLVQTGVYRENLEVDKQLTLKGYDSGGEKPEIDAGGNRNGITLNADNVTVQGLCVTNARIGIEVVSSNNKIIGNEIRDSWTGIAIISSNGNVLKNNLASDGWRGIYLKDSSDNAIIGNVVRDNKWSGFVFESSNNNLAKENQIRSNYRGFELINSDKNTFSDNILAENRYDDELVSAEATRDLEDIVGEQSFEAPSVKVNETEPLGTIGSEPVQPDDERSGKVFEEKLGDTVDETMLSEPEEPVTSSAIDMQEDAGLTVEFSAAETDEEHLESIIADEIQQPFDEDAFQDGTVYEMYDSGEDVQSEGLPARTYEGKIEPEPAHEVIDPIKDAVHEDPLIRYGSEEEQIKYEEEVMAIGAEEDSPLEEMDSEAAGNDTVLIGESGAQRTKSSSGGWKIYELLKSLGERRRDEGTEAQPMLSEMNFSEMVKMEVERLDLGTVSFYSAKEMTIGVSEKVEAAIAKDINEELTIRLKDLGACEAEIAELNVSTRSHLEGENFLIEPLDDEVWWFEANDGISHWSWDVTPLKSGVQDLELHVAVVVAIPDGITVQKEYPSIERRTGVDLSLVHIVLYLAERVSDFTGIQHEALSF